MSLPRFLVTIAGLAFILSAALCSPVLAADMPTRDLRFFLTRLRTLDHLPELEASHTAMSSTWDRSGNNNDGLDFKRLEGTRNILLDEDGPGCIHRIFVGWLGKHVEGTRIQIFFDGADRPTLDFTVEEFFNDKSGPLPYPLVFHKTYPGTLFPFPYEKHCRVQLVNEKATNWSCYWQVTYTTYPAGTPVQTLSWPLNDAEQAELKTVCQHWLDAEITPPVPPKDHWTKAKLPVGPGRSESLKLEGAGVIRELRLDIPQAPPSALDKIRLKIRWDGANEPSVDAPIGSFFGATAAASRSEARFNSMLVSVNEKEMCCRFPMPFEKGAEIALEAATDVRPLDFTVTLDVEKRESIPINWGRFHATWKQDRAASADSPAFGPKKIPAHLALDRSARGKYVGVMLEVDWPYRSWWGEGDWLIWTDENAWPPSYHGTGSEEYFNSGWCLFDRKAVSGYVTTHPGRATVYTFHLNDAFQFQKNVRVAEETTCNSKIDEFHPWWTTTAYWYALPAQPAESTK